MPHFFYKLSPPRPSFPADMTEAEGRVMEAHFGYWSSLIAAGNVVAYGPVLDPRGSYGIAVLELEDAAAAAEIGNHDPAVQAQAGFSFEVHAMPDAQVRT